MSRTLLTNIKQLLQVRKAGVERVKGSDMAEVPRIENAYLVLEDGKILGFGTMEDHSIPGADKVIDCMERLVMPAFCDSHSHVVFAASRADEFVLKIKGASYEEIAAAGGGIINSASKLALTSESELYDSAHARISRLIAQGTGALEIKSGYGLSTQSELKMLRVIRSLKESLPIPIKATFLGAHAVPAEFKGNKAGYLDLVIEEMLPQLAAEGLADYIDIFCERNYFDADDTKRILEAGAKHGLRGKVHTNQFSSCGGIQAAIANNALSVDHLEVLPPEDLEALCASDVLPVALPGCSFFSNLPYAPARQIIQSGKALALASDYNPGSAPAGNMQLIFSLACIKLRLTPEEALNAITINGVVAMELDQELGSITVGKKANLLITEPMNSLADLPYDFGNNKVWKMLLSED